MEFIEEARKRLAEEERIKKIQQEQDRLTKKQQEIASASAVQEQMIMLESERMCVELEARQLVIEREAQRLAAEKEAAISAEMERLRNRSPLEKLQDDFEELKRQMEAKEAKKAVVIKVAKPVLKKETLKESWAALLEWQHWKKLYQDASNAWSVNEYNITANKDLFKYGFSGKIDGTVKEAYLLSEVSAELQKTQDELNALQSRYNVHKVSYQKALKDTQEARQNHMTIFHNKHHADFMVPSSGLALQYGSMQVDQAKRTTGLAELQKKIDICVAVEAQMKVVADKEDADWKENKEKDKLNEKIRYLSPLKTSYTGLIKSFEFIGCYDEHYTKAIQTAKKVTGMEDLELAWEQAFSLMVKARSA